jgi:hypothetical protein
MCAWAFVSQDLPPNSVTLQFQVLMSMQMDVEFKKEQIGTHFVYVGALEGGFGGWVVPHGCPSGVPLNNKTPSWHQSKVIFSAGSRFFFGPCLVF